MNNSIYLGGGCFWCTEAIYLKVDGVVSVKSGYSGGFIKNPSYREVCSGKLDYNEIITLDQILNIFFTVHDPTSINRQGADVGTQYRSAIFCKQDERSFIVNFIQELESQNVFSDKIVTEVNDIQKFFIAEDYHHDYFTKNPENAYCQAVINPKLNKLRSLFSDLISE